MVGEGLGFRARGRCPDAEQKALPGCISHPSLLCVPDPTPTGLAQALFCTTWACFGQASASLSTYEPPHPKEGNPLDPCCSCLFHREQAEPNTLHSGPRRVPKTPSLVLP